LDGDLARTLSVPHEPGTCLPDQSGTDKDDANDRHVLAGADKSSLDTFERDVYVPAVWKITASTLAKAVPRYPGRDDRTMSG